MVISIYCMGMNMYFNGSESILHGRDELASANGKKKRVTGNMGK